MSDFVVDNSVSMSWAFEDESNQYADAVLDSLQSKEAAVPVIWPLEAANVLVVAQRQQRLSATDHLRFLALLRDLPIEVVEERVSIRDMIDIAWEMELSAYDASYLELALNRTLPLATCDKRLRRAVGEVGVDLWLKD